MSNSELACVYATLILHDDGVDITVRGVTTALRAAGAPRRRPRTPSAAHHQRRAISSAARAARARARAPGAPKRPIRPAGARPAGARPAGAGRPIACSPVRPPPQAENISSLVKAAGVEVEPYWPALFAGLAAKKNIDEFILSVGSGGGGGGAAAPAAGGGGGDAAHAAAKEEEKEEEEDADMGFSLFD
jgi:large subunit ribosomal protein LP1